LLFFAASANSKQQKSAKNENPDYFLWSLDATVINLKYN
jgi:hypothetical protein